MAGMNYFLIIACKAQRENVQIIDDLRLITGFVIRVTGRVSLVEQELTIFPKHLCSPPVFGGVRVTQSSIL
jgi:hypothetical protein